MSAWTRLQAVLTEHSLEDYQQTYRRVPGMVPPRRINAPYLTEEGCKVLGRGDEAEIKVELAWWQYNHEETFNRSRRFMPHTPTTNQKEG